MRRVFGPAVAALLGSGCTQLGSPLVPAGPQAARIASHWWLMFWVCAAVWVVVAIVLVIAAARARGIQTEAGRVIPASAERGVTLVVGGATAITTVILVVLLAAAV